MTGYGKSVLQLNSKKITLEIKSLNSKNLDINSRFPGVYKEKEMEVRRTVARELVRGKIDMSFYIESTAEESSTVINQAVVKNYISVLEEIRAEGDLLSIAMRMPDVLKTEREELDEEEWMQIEAGIQEAINHLQDYRTAEGQELKTDFIYRIGLIGERLAEVSEIDPQRLDMIKERLQKAITELKQTVDENRFEQELIYYLEKLDIT